MSTPDNQSAQVLKNYAVSISAFATVVVIGAKNEDEAIDLACEKIRFGDLQMDEASLKEEIETPEELASHRRHADLVVTA